MLFSILPLPVWRKLRVSAVSAHHRHPAPVQLIPAHGSRYDASQRHVQYPRHTFWGAHIADTSAKAPPPNAGTDHPHEPHLISRPSMPHTNPCHANGSDIHPGTRMRPGQALFAIHQAIPGLPHRIPDVTCHFCYVISGSECNDVALPPS